MFCGLFFCAGRTMPPDIRRVALFVRPLPHLEKEVGVHAFKEEATRRFFVRKNAAGALEARAPPLAYGAKLC